MRVAVMEPPPLLCQLLNLAKKGWGGALGWKVDERRLLAWCLLGFYSVFFLETLPTI